MKDLKKGQVVYECEYGLNIKMICQEDAKRGTGDQSNGFECLAIDETGKEVHLFQDEHATHYGPKLYAEKQYHEANHG